jgi:hypothetical protein
MKKITILGFILLGVFSKSFSQTRISAVIHGNNQNLWNDPNSNSRIGGFGFGASVYFKRSKNFWIGTELSNYKIGESVETLSSIAYPSYSSYYSNVLHKEGKMYTATFGFEYYVLPTKRISPFLGAASGLAVLNLQPYTENFRGDLIPIITPERKTSYGIISALKLGVMGEVSNSFGALAQISFQPITGTELKTRGLWNIKFGLNYTFKN